MKTQSVQPSAIKNWFYNLTPPSLPYVKIAECVSILALGSFALYVKPTFFIGAFTLGTVYQFVKIKLNLSSPENGMSRPGCGQGYGEFFSGIKFWPIEVVVVIAALAWEHLQMAPQFYAPLFGFFIGMRAMHLVLIPRPTLSEDCCCKAPLSQ